MTEPVADDILRSGYERWRRLEEEKAAIGEDLKELMAELKGQGYTPKALRESFRRVRNAGDADRQEHDALVDLYVAALTRGTRERAREIIEEFPADEPEHDPLTGEIIEHDPEPIVAQAGEADPGATSVQPQVRDGLSVTQSLPVTIPDAAQSSLAGVEGDADRQPIQESTAARKDVPSGALAPKKVSVAGTQAPSVDTDPEPGSKGSGFVLDREVTASSPAPVIPFKHPDDGRPRSGSGLPRPVGCQHVDTCAKTWRDTEPCSLCRQMVAVEPGGVDMDHHGVVA